MRDVRTYERLSVAPIEVIASGFRDGGIGAAGRIGVELGFEQRLGMPIAELERIRDAERPAELVDAADPLWALRVVKSSSEIEAMRRACAITGHLVTHLQAAHLEGSWSSKMRTYTGP